LIGINPFAISIKPIDPSTMASLMSRFLSLFILGFSLFSSAAIAEEAKARNLGIGFDETPPPMVEEPPALPSIAELGPTDPDLSILVELVVIAGLGEALALPRPLTVFAPTNAAFAEVIIDLEDLEILDVEVVTVLLAYHVVPGEIMASDITDGLVLETLLPGETIQFGIEGDVVTVNGEVISTTDIVASNGVIHKIDGVMFPQIFLGPETDAKEEEPSTPPEILDETPPPMVEEPPGDVLLTIAELGMSDPDLSILLELVTIAGLGEALALPQPITVFAPTNDAFAEIIPDPENLVVLDVEVVTNLLTYHVLRDPVMAADITDGLILPTLMGEFLEFGIDGDVVTVNGEVISTTDIVASNGVIHKIDGVLIPPSFLAPQTDAPVEAEPLPTIAELGPADPDLSMLVELVITAGLGDALSLPGPMTVFAPTNAAFNKTMAEFDDLATFDAATMTMLLAYHVVPGKIMAANITDGLILSTLMGETLEFGIDGDVVTVNDEVISTTDIVASNGVIHKIDGVLIPQAFLGF
jgi:transforming growth factor-beta-induced protein